MLNKEGLQKDIQKGLKKVYLEQAKLATEGDEKESPEDALERITHQMAEVISDAVDRYVRTGDIIIDSTIIGVTTSSGPAQVTPLTPANLQ